MLWIISAPSGVIVSSPAILSVFLYGHFYLSFSKFPFTPLPKTSPPWENPLGFCSASWYVCVWPIAVQQRAGLTRLVQTKRGNLARETRTCTHIEREILKHRLSMVWFYSYLQKVRIDRTTLCMFVLDIK